MYIEVESMNEEKDNKYEDIIHKLAEHYLEINKDKNKLRKFIEDSTNQTIMEGGEMELRVMFVVGQLKGDIPKDLEYSRENFINALFNVVINHATEVENFMRGKLYGYLMLKKLVELPKGIRLFIYSEIKKGMEYGLKSIFEVCKDLGFAPKDLEYSPENLLNTLMYIVDNKIKIDWVVEEDKNGRHYITKDGKRIYFD